MIFILIQNTKNTKRNQMRICLQTTSAGTNYRFGKIFIPKQIGPNILHSNAFRRLLAAVM